MPRLAPRNCASLLFLSLLIGATATARAEAPDCVATHERAVANRNAGKLTLAQAGFAECTVPTCPGPVREECAAEARRLDSVIPSVIPAAKSADGRELSSVRVLADGRRLSDALDGRAHRLDPGPHTLRFESDGMRPREVEVVLAEGDQLRKVAVVLGSSLATPSRKPSPAAAYVLAGAGVIGLAGFGYFGLSGLSQENELEAAGCEPNCSKDKTDELKRTFLFADISLAIGVVGLGAATWVFVSSRSDPSPSSTGRTTTLAIRGAF